MHPLHNFGHKKITRIVQVTEILRQKWDSLRMILTEIVFAAVQLVSIDWNVGVMCELGQRNTTFEHLHCLVTFQMSSEVNDHRRPSYLPWVTKFAFCDFHFLSFLHFLEVLRSFIEFIFTQACSECLLTVSDVSQGHWPTLHLGNFSEEESLLQESSGMFPSGMSFVAIIRSRCSITHYSVQN